jgi:DNA-binding NtrC family response regulator
MVLRFLQMGFRILAVDDEPQLVLLVTRYLEHLGYEVVYESRTESAWERVERGERFALAIVDFSMEGPTAEELGRRILGVDAEARVMLMSGYAADLRAIEEAFPGRVSFLQKPFSGEMLAEAVGRVLGH